jgi:DNA invertase Pin-like site-specific DNA recombinase
MAYQNPNAATVVRVSTDKQGSPDHFGMDAQRAFNAQEVAREGLTVLHAMEYKDVSGDAVMYTREMQELQAFLRTPKMKNGHLVVKELSRLLRPDFNSYHLLQVFVDQRITIHTLGHKLELWTPQGRMLVGLLCPVDFNEAERIRERCMGGREEMRKVGLCASGSKTRPTGTTYDPKTKKWGYDDVYAPKLREAGCMVLDGETNWQHIIDKLQFRLRGSSRLATPTALCRLLSNPIFMGWRVWDQKTDMSVPRHAVMYVAEDGTVRRKKRPMIPREPDEIIRVQVITPGLFSPEEFEKIQAIVRAKSDAVHQLHALHRDRPKPTYNGLISCADCGQPLYPVYSSHRYFRCRDHNKHRGGTGRCTAPSMRMERLEAELDRFFSVEFTRTHFLTRLMQEHDGRENRKAMAQRRKQLDARQKVLSAKRERIIDAQLDGTITKPDRDRRLKIVDDEMKSNRQAIAELVETPLPTYAEWQRLFRPFMRGFKGLPVEEKRRLIMSRFQQIKVKDYRVVSLYLLTGEAAVVRDLPARSEEKCHTCACVLTADDLSYNQECGVDVSWRFCRSCLDSSPKERAAREYRSYGYDPIPQDSTFCNSSLRS